jgi:hypothetical protein
LGLDQKFNLVQPRPRPLAMMLPPQIYSISSENKLPTIFSIGFVAVEFWTCLKDRISIILDEIPCENSCTCFRMYLRNAVLDQHQTSMIKKMGVPAKYIAMAAPDRIDFDPILDRLIPSFVSPIATTPSRIRFTIISDVMLMILFPCFARETGEFGFVPLYEQIHVTIDVQIFTGHKLTLFVFHWVTVSAFLLFFCHSNVIAMQSAEFKLVEL